jgi:DNA-binding CsgD family transcriptional regulator
MHGNRSPAGRSACRNRDAVASPATAAVGVRSSYLRRMTGSKDAGKAVSLEVPPGCMESLRSCARQTVRDLSHALARILSDPDCDNDDLRPCADLSRDLNSVRRLLDSVGWAPGPRTARLRRDRDGPGLEILLSRKHHRQSESRAGRCPAFTASVRAFVARPQGSGAQPDLAQLTSREWEVFGYLVIEESYATIAAELHLSIETVRTHARRIRRKCGVARSSELASLYDPLRSRWAI